MWVIFFATFVLLLCDSGWHIKGCKVRGDAQELWDAPAGAQSV